MTGTLLAAVLALALGTWLLRAGGVLLADRVTVPDRATHLVGTATTVLLCALVVTSTVFEGGGLAGPSRVAGVVVGGVLAWRRVPFVAAVVLAAATTALLRAVGVP